MTVNRRDLVKATALGATALGATACSTGVTAKPRAGAFKPSWESLAQGYQTPDWFRDAKLGLWAHWGPQCIPEYGDWYGRQMYMQGNYVYEHHLKTYGHPAQVGFMELLKDWKVDAWEPEKLIGLYKAAGAKYFVAMANHHDNFDMFDSRYQSWNATKIGPKRDICGEWAKAARGAGLRFGLSNHAAHAWHWWQTAYAYDPEGPVRGLRYDAARLTLADGKGKWWEGLDPQELYGGGQCEMIPPEGISTIKEMNDFHDHHSGQWLETAPPRDPYYVRKWLLRQNDMVDKYHPDLVYFDNYTLPLEAAGLEASAYYYNQSLKRNGQVQVVATGKRLNDLQRRAITEDIERGFSDSLRPIPWQTCTCIGNWHYDRGLYERNGYKTALDVIQRLNDVVAKNGNMLLSIPVRGNGAIDDKEEKILAEMAQWMSVNGEAIFGTRPWAIYGEGPFRVVEGQMNEGAAKAFTPEDIRFTTKAGTLYALPQAWPESGFVTIRSFAEGSPHRPDATKGSIIDRIELLGHAEPLRFEPGFGGLTVKLPANRPSFTPALKIMGKGLTGF